RRCIPPRIPRARPLPPWPSAWAWAWASVAQEAGSDRCNPVRRSSQKGEGLRASSATSPPAALLRLLFRHLLLAEKAEGRRRKVRRQEDLVAFHGGAAELDLRYIDDPLHPAYLVQKGEHLVVAPAHL